MSTLDLFSTEVQEQILNWSHNIYCAEEIIILSDLQIIQVYNIHLIPKNFNYLKNK